MAYKKMKFKGQTVFVEVDDSGSVCVDGGRARMKYRVDDERVYRPSPKNLVELDHRPEQTPTGAVVAYTDGACIGNPGPSGIGYVIIFPDGRRVQRGEPLGVGTNNIAELTAILRVLGQIDQTRHKISIHTDSSYSIGVLQGGWKAKANKELIAEIRQELTRYPNLELVKVKGHAGISDNELVDDLARRAAESQKQISE